MSWHWNRNRCHKKGFRSIVRDNHLKHTPFLFKSRNDKLSFLFLKHSVSPISSAVYKDCWRYIWHCYVNGKADICLWKFWSINFLFRFLKWLLVTKILFFKKIFHFQKVDLSSQHKDNYFSFFRKVCVWLWLIHQTNWIIHLLLFSLFNLTIRQK